jgi:hypothetical protein
LDPTIGLLPFKKHALMILVRPPGPPPAGSWLLALLLLLTAPCLTEAAAGGEDFGCSRLKAAVAALLPPLTTAEGLHSGD